LNRLEKILIYNISLVNNIGYSNLSFHGLTNSDRLRSQ